MDNNRSVQSNLGRIQVSFVEFAERPDQPTLPYLDSVRALVKGIPAPGHRGTGSRRPADRPPVNIEVAGDDFDAIAKVAKTFTTSWTPAGSMASKT